ncbi:MAG: alpha/beta hydrolase [Lactobacillus sp.]|jgi:alpha-beta hydrolase superfamily lysophospholipase|nr:lysophospholipase [Lactobacillus sp.]MCH3906129.1 lysophospholipase [Lactobacillus sp.]MCI1466648.1 alpha/beta hydrolase [Lactobacillus sp.]MCI1480946.1 alpha/beta hydrolase [Lactobacillus sp.]MCI1883397.1 alpha/beta hydrolase [Lactobacillus sp.]
MSFYDNEKSAMIPSYKDGMKLHLVTDLADTPQANLVIVHGLAEYAGRYDPIASYMVKHDFNVFRYDQFGHGESDGDRGFLSSPDDLSENCALVVEYVKSHYFDLPTFVLGHSMGGQTVLLYGSKHPGKADGLIVTDPVSVETHQAEHFSVELPDDVDEHQEMPNAINGGLDRDQRIVDKYVADPKVLHTLQAGIFKNAMLPGALYLRDNLQNLTDPILYLQGLEDGLINYQDALESYTKIGAKDRELHVYPFLMHEILNDNERKWDIYDEVIRWINKRLY